MEPIDSDRVSYQPQGSAWRSAHAWVTTTYFAEGFPYTIVNNIAEIVFKELGASLQAIGLTALFHLPWNLKFLWGPLLDSYETKRRWLLGTELVLTALLLILAALGATLPVLGLITLCMFGMAVVSATHDIAIDGFYLEGLDQAGQSRFVGYRAAAYRVATIVVLGPFVVVAGRYGWRVAWVLAAVVTGLLLLYHAAALPRTERRQRAIGELLSGMLRPRVLAIAGVLAAIVAAEGRLVLLRPAWSQVEAAIEAVPVLARMSVADWVGLALLLVLLVMLLALGSLRRRMERSDSAYARAFVDFLAQPKIGRVLAFIVLFRTGESFLMKMRLPFLRDEAGVSLETYGWVNGTIGFGATVVATLVGGYLISRDGLRRWIWPFILAQNLLNLLYAGLALWPSPAEVGTGIVGVVITVEHFGAGLGTAVFMVYIMRACDPAHKAAHMAILTALMSVGFTVAGVASGFVASAIGFGPYFVFTFVATIPMMVLVPFVPHIDGREHVEPAG